MTEFLVKLFIKQKDDVRDIRVREQYGMLSSLVGILCNIVLFLLKFAIGTLANSLSIISDGFNNLSDSASSIVSFVGYKLAAKPADKDHPFGHGRIEYLISLIIASAILLVGFELGKSSFAKILAPEPVKFSVVALISLLLSIGVKLWLYAFNTSLGNKIHSPGMIATAKDSLTDVIATSATLLTLCFSLISDFSIDGYAGIVVSCFIMYSGYEIIRDTVDTLLGQHADAETVDDIVSIIKSKEGILGVHDLIVHNYGPGKMIASAHVEVRSDVDIIHSHDQIDLIEREIQDKLGIGITLHMDPIDVNNEMLAHLREEIVVILESIDPRLSSHDYRMVRGETHHNVIFDVEVPFEVKHSNEEIKDIIDTALKSKYPEINTVITFDRSFI